MDFLAQHFNIVAVLVGWILSTAGLIMFLAYWFGRFEGKFDRLITDASDSKKSVTELSGQVQHIGQRVANVEGRVQSLESKK